METDLAGKLLEEIQGKWYFFDPEGYMKIGWFMWQDRWYYCTEKGYMLRDWHHGGRLLAGRGRGADSSIKKAAIQEGPAMNGLEVSDVEIRGTEFLKALDLSYSYRLAKQMEKPRTNPVLGFRTAGSKAEFETGELLVREMKEIGLKM